jgi:DNA (cytosine-5)-methyltransferase 1
VLSSSLRTQHTPESRQRFLQTPCGSVEPVSRFFRLDPRGFCNTLRAGTGSERGAFTSPRPIHYRYVRCITNREAARLHSYPDWFRFHVTKWHGFRQIGNSVPPLMARAIASRIAAALGQVPTSPASGIPLGDPCLLRFSMTEACLHYGVNRTIPSRVREP